MKKKIIAIIQARIGSSRLPGKSMKLILGRPMLWYQLRQIAKSKKITQVVVATTNQKKDRVISNYCKKKKIECFKGDEKNVLQRYFFASLKYKADIIVRLTSDCPLIDPKIIDKSISIFQRNDYDYVSNTCPPEGATYTDGMDVEVFDFFSLSTAYLKCKNDSENEHVTHFFWKKNNGFKTFRFNLKSNYRNYRLTVDYIEDFILIKKIIYYFKKNKINISYNNIIRFMKKNKKISQINLCRNKDFVTTGVNN